MVQIQLINGEIQISSNEIVENEDDMLKELNRVLCFTISIYKRRIEKLKNEKINEIDEVIINQRIKDAIVMIPLEEIREFINVSEI